MDNKQKPLALHKITSFEELNRLYAYHMGLVYLANKFLVSLEDPKSTVMKHFYDYDTLTDIILTAQEEMEQLKTYHSIALQLESILCDEKPPF